MNTKRLSISEETILGMLAGATFAFSAWGFDGIFLSGANGVLPWLKFFIGLFPSMILFALLGYLNVKIINLVFKLILWISAAFLIGWLVTQVNFIFYPKIFGALKPDIAELLHYVIPETISKRLFVITVMSGVFLILGGLLMDATLEAIRFSRGFVGTLVAVFFWVFFFLGAGYVTDSNYNEMLREPVIVLNDSLDEVSKIDLSTASEWTKQMVKRYTQLGVNLAGERHLAVSSFDESFNQVRILVDFYEKQAMCVVSGSHVSTCKLLESQDS